MKRVWVILIFVMLFSVLVSAQKSKRKKPIAVVTVTAPKLPKVVLPKETDGGLWNEFASINDGFSVVFPAKAKDIFEDSLDDGNFYQATTSTANYSVSVKKFKNFYPIGNELEAIYDNVILEAQPDKIIKSVNIFQNELQGREAVFESKKKRFFVRFFGFENNFILAAVTIDAIKYTNDFDVWVAKFFDSLIVKAKIKEKVKTIG